MTREEYCGKARDMAYAERVGKVYGDYEVKSIRYDKEKKKQEWTLECQHCGKVKVTMAWQNFVNGRSGHCKNCDRVGNTLIGCKNGGFKVNRAWENEDEVCLEVECENCGRLIKAGYWQYVCKGIVCDCKNQGGYKMFH